MKDYYRHKIEDFLVVNEIVTIHRFEFDADFRSAGEEHDFWELVYADRGEVECSASGRNVTLVEGEMLFHAPGEFHTLAARGNVRPRVLIVAFACGSEAMRFFEGKKLAVPRALIGTLHEIVAEGEATFDLKRDSPFRTKIELRPDSPLGGKQMIKALLETLLIKILRRENERKSEPVFLRKNEIGGRLAEQVIDVLESKVGERASARDICAAVNYGKSYVFQQFRLATGKSVMAYFNELKIERAKKLLLEGNLNVSEIAAALAFDTPNYFTKSFRRMTGLTPTQWRKSPSPPSPRA